MSLEQEPIPAASLQEALDELVDRSIASGRGQSWLADKINVSPRAVRMWVSGQRALSGASAVAVRSVIREVL